MARAQPKLAAPLALCAAVLALAASSSGCASTEAMRGFPPFFELGAWGDDSAPDVVFRPLFGYRERAEDFRGPYGFQDRTDVHYLFPFGQYKRRGQNVDHHLWPIFQWTKNVDADGFVSRDFLFFPIIWGGHDPVEGSYFTFFPLGGTLKGLFGKDLIVHALFPLFLFTQLHEYKAVHFLFPIFGYWWGEGNEGFRVLPFYGHQRKSRDGVVVADRYTVLWPLFEWEYDNLNSQNPFTAWVIFPFYGQTRSRLVDETTVLWPFFRKRNEKVDGIVRWRVPFPFVMLAFGNETQYDFWPLFGYRHNAHYTRHFALWPVFRREVYERPDEKHVDTRTWLLPIYWGFSRTDKTTGEEVYSHRKVFPLFRIDRGADGTFGLHFPSILWFADSDHVNFETILTPLFELFRYRNDPAQGRELRLLFSIFMTRWDRPDGENGWSLFGGLVGHRTTRDGEGRVRFLWFFEV